MLQKLHLCNSRRIVLEDRLYAVDIFADLDEK
jgi:hypothetical protein